MQTNRRFLGGVVAVGLLFSGAAGAYPTGSFCPASGTNADNLSLGDVTLNSSSADGCYGVEDGNLQSSSASNSAFNTAVSNPSSSWYDPANLWKFVDADNGTAAAFRTIEFQIKDLDVDGASGSFTLAWKDLAVGVPLDYSFNLDLAIAIKASDRWAAWFFDQVLFEADGSAAGAFTINFSGPGGGPNQPPPLAGFSHLLVYARNGDPLYPPEQPQPPTNVPIPGTLALIGVGLLGFTGSFARRRKA